MLSLKTLRGLLLGLAISSAALAQEPPLGRNVESLLEYAKTRNPEYAAMQEEADASLERITPAGALPGPALRTELPDITQMGEQHAKVAPSKVSSPRTMLTSCTPRF